MPEIAWNKSHWDGEYQWNVGGEEWSAAWGGSEAQWFGSIYPRLHRLLPAKHVLEIAPGFGRWTRFLIDGSESFTGIDLSSAAIEHCERRFAGASNAKFHLNDGIFGRFLARFGQTSY